MYREAMYKRKELRKGGWVGDPYLNPKNYNLRSLTLIGEDPMINFQ